MRRHLSRVLAGGLTPFLVAGLTIASGAAAQEALKDAVQAPIKALRSGPLLMHGNFCGIGARPGKLPIDALDEACMRHDACTKTGTLPSCACDDRLRIEAVAVAKDPATKPDVQAVALATASAMALLICKVTPAVPPGASPPAPVPTTPPPPIER